ncbi:ADP-ribosylation factor-like protein 3A [Trypanosoma theileri]|uniref:ADP-ribosylation factor-like protein 3A n=1 Tax=Trypanosoma theileri TaxID=67003 RepID=A0A1X0NZP8_9TRYP|nr:ADP-ribosylation factor-like protein 3A [Trypanosoma theileri]ORC90152.1 ADP-ribosylation factor-like protein 3A [Trypanosoma theileri]
MVTSKSKKLEPNICWRCGVLLNSRTTQSAIQCKVCNRSFHRKCYLTDTGIGKDDVQSCVCCLCGVLRLPYPPRIQENSLAVKFLRDGYCVISLSNNPKEKKILLETLEKFRVNAERYFNAFMRSYENELEFSTKVPSLESGFSNFRERGKGRFELISSEIEKEVQSLLKKSKLLWNTLDLLLTPASRRVREAKKVMSAGCFYSLPGSSLQNLHTDGPSLSSVKDLYPYAVNVFIPLVPFDKTNGTEFFPGSHRIEWQSIDPQKRKSKIPTIPLGMALLFDYRVLHRGLRNQRGSPRPCYYTTVVRSWYKDKFNFSLARYRTTLNVPSYLLENRKGESMRKKRKTE